MGPWTPCLFGHLRHPHEVHTDVSLNSAFPPRNPLSRYGLKPMYPWGMDKMDGSLALVTQRRWPMRCEGRLAIGPPVASDGVNGSDTWIRRVTANSLAGPFA